PDQTNNPVNPVNGHGAPTYRDSELNVRAWNQANAAARTAGVNGHAAADYFGTKDTAFDPDATATMGSVDQRFVLGGACVLDAFRFWYANPAYDQGYALQLSAGTVDESKFHASEEDLGKDGPVLTIAYTLPPTSSPVPVEVSAPAAGVPLLVDK